MSFFNLKLYRRSDTRIILTIPLLTRLVILFFAAAVAYTFTIDPGFSVLPLVFLVVLIFTALYKESWTFDSEKKEAVYGFGLLFLYKKTLIPFKLIESFHIEGFVRGSMTEKPVQDEVESKGKSKRFRTVYWKLSLLNSELGELTINTVKGRQKEILSQYAGEIARLCSVKLTEE